MGRRALIARSYRWLRLVRALAARHHLAVHIAKRQQLARALGLTESTIGQFPNGTAVSDQDFGSIRLLAALPVSLPLQLPFKEQAESEENTPFVPEEPEEMSDQQSPHSSQLEEEAYQELVSTVQPLVVADRETMEPAGKPQLAGVELPEAHGLELLQEPAIMDEEEPTVSEALHPALNRHEDVAQRSAGEEPNESQLAKEQQRAESIVPAVETGRARRRRGSIQEQPVGIDQARTAPRHSGKDGGKEQQKPASRSFKSSLQGEKEQEEPTADALFAPRGTDRSPQAWMARLLGTRSAARGDVASPVVDSAQEQAAILTRGSGREQSISQSRTATGDQLAGDEVVPSSDERRRVPEPGTGGAREQEAGKRRLILKAANVVNADVQARTDPAPLSRHARRFLQPLVGIELEKVPVYRDAAAGRLTDAYQADAITIGERVEMAEGHLDDTPETLGLLAHEFTHVARRRAPQFVPPIVRPLPGQSSLMSEEALARRVEGRVRGVAQAQIEQMISSVPGSEEITDALAAGAPQAIPASYAQPDAWGGLPAPWEPLPDWLAASSGQAAAVSIQSISADHETGAGERNAGEAYGESTMPAVQRAGRERSSSEEEVQPDSSSPQPTTPASQSPEPDLDELARQVYTLLKRRLSVEYRRES